MAGTMDKADVKLSFEPLSSVKWDQVTQVSGKTVPQLCKTTVEEVLEGVKTKKYKKPYGKVGLIKKNLYFRIKDGNTHIEDILLVKNWSEPVQAEELTKPKQRALDEWIQSRKDLLKAVEDGHDNAKELVKSLDLKCSRIEDYLKMAKAGVKGTVTGTGLSSNADKATELLLEIKNAAEAIQKIHSDDVFPVYERHRTMKGPDEKHDLPPASYGEYAKTFFLQTVGPVYKKLERVIKEAEAFFEGAKKNYELLVRWTSDGTSALDNYKEEAQIVFDEMTKEFNLMKSEEGMSPFINLQNGLLSDTNNLSEFAPELLDRLLDNATGKITKAKETMKRILTREKTINEQFARVKAIPKPIQNDPLLKPILVKIVQLYPQVGAYVKQMTTYLLAGNKQFVKFRQEYDKKVQ